MIDSHSLLMRKQKVEIIEHLDRQITIKFNRRSQDFHEVFEVKSAKIEEAKKECIEVKKKKGKHILTPDHPWKRHDPRLHHNYYLERT